ncbi:chromophore lyase [Neisseria arctica]|uniref:Chromophore lyase n=1 Tax=Neisseria arctica TaxID=1470200 RepID=A0A0J0YSZ0_9NEIS|nr:helix-turn-helix transcriptional regulator [Neisseria arctica]KLT73275.1 chromophore lyase [Neisseria arctica]UOO87467.1 helix-turn-helix transcriptional regulator [Neisseria arctica]
MNEITERLYKAAEELKGVKGQSALARLLNTSPQTVKNWETRGVSKQGMIEAARIIGCSIFWLETGRGEMTSGQPIESNATIIGGVDAWDNNTPLDDDDCEVPLYKHIELSAGNGFAADISEYNDGNKLRFSRRTLRKSGVAPENVVCVKIEGNSMEPVLPDGSTIGIDTGDKRIRDGKIYAINHGGLLRTKILQNLPDNKIRVKSYNTAEWPDEEVSAEDVSIIGRVFWWSVLD